jgi:hypothetical protein
MDADLDKRISDLAYDYLSSQSWFGLLPAEDRLGIGDRLTRELKETMTMLGAWAKNFAQEASDGNNRRR